MTLEIFYFICFLVGFLLSLLTFAGGTHLHLPKGMHVHGMAHPGGHCQAHGSVKGGAHTGPASWFNFSTITAFLAWFGGTGYLLTRYSNLFAALALGIATLSGVGGAAIVFWFLFRFLLANERDLDPADYNMIGVLGRVSISVRLGGTGEMIFSQEGARRCVAIRSEDGRAIARGSEVVIMRYDKGIGYVRPWDELSGPEEDPPLSAPPADETTRRNSSQAQSDAVN
jgi:hypothetical protein